jgi:hypothetical protein
LEFEKAHLAGADELVAMETLLQPILAASCESLRKLRMEARANPKTPLVALI